VKVLYDISVLGLGHFHLRARTGIYRAIEQIAYGLAESKECEVAFCASQGNYAECLEYFRANTRWANRGAMSPYNLLFKMDSLTGHFSPRTFLYGALKRLRSGSNAALNRLPKVDLEKTDIYHSTFYPVPGKMRSSKKMKIFQTVYDLIPILHPEFFKFNEDHLIKKVLKAIGRDDFVICISESTKRDLCNYRKDIDADKVFVISLAASESFYQCTDHDRLSAVKRKYNIPADRRYILSVCTLEPRKNIEQSIRSFVRLITEQKIDDLCLVLTGTKGWDYNKIFKEISHSIQVKEKIILTGYVPDEDLAPLYSGAVMFVYPSFYEGFGLPPLEAMQCGTPVIASNTSSLPEVVSDAGIMVDPMDGDAVCQAMLDLYNKPSLRQTMSLKSLERAGQFSWKKCTLYTINAYKAALGN